MSSKFFQEIHVKLPRTIRRQERAYTSCEKRGRFVIVDRGSFTGHLELAKDDLVALKADLEHNNWRWAIIKSYYAIFHATNALLVHELDFYSKDHLCAVIALKRKELILESLYTELGSIYEQFSDIFGFAVLFEARKLSQYDTEKWRDIGEQEAMISRDFARRFVSFAEVECT